MLEVSPSGNWTRVMNQHGLKYWTDTNGITPLEVLPPIERCPGPHEEPSPKED